MQPDTLQPDTAATVADFFATGYKQPDTITWFFFATGSTVSGSPPRKFCATGYIRLVQPDQLATGYTVYPDTQTRLNHGFSVYPDTLTQELHS